MATKNKEIVERTKEVFSKLENKFENATGLNIEFIADETPSKNPNVYDGDKHSISDITLHVVSQYSTGLDAKKRDHGLYEKDSPHYFPGIEKIRKPNHITDDNYIFFNTYEVMHPITSNKHKYQKNTYKLLGPRFNTNIVNVLDDNYRIKRSICNTDNQFFILNGVYEEFVQKCLISAFGLNMDGSSSYNFEHYLFLLNLLYDTQINPGMTKKQILPLVTRNIYNTKQ